MAGEKTGPNPTDRAKKGVKRSLLTEASGVPIGLAIEGANRHDCKMVEATIDSIPVERPEPTEKESQGMCLDKGYDSGEVRDLVKEFGYTAHIHSRGEEAQSIKREAGFKARRWVVERTHSWMNRLSPFDNDYAIVDPKTPRRVARDARIKQRRGLIQLCTIVDAWLPEAQQYDIGQKCLEAILAEPSWTVRILTKNAAIQKDFDLIGKYKNRVLVIYTDDECNRMVRAASQV